MVIHGSIKTCFVYTIGGAMITIIVHLRGLYPLLCVLKKQLMFGC